MGWGWKLGGGGRHGRFGEATMTPGFVLGHTPPNDKVEKFLQQCRSKSVGEGGGMRKGEGGGSAGRAGVSVPPPPRPARHPRTQPARSQTLK